MPTYRTWELGCKLCKMGNAVLGTTVKEKDNKR